MRLCVHKQFLQTTSPPKPLIGFWPNFTGMILGWSFFKVVQMVPVHYISRSQELKIDFFNWKLKKSSCQKPLDRFQYNFAKMFLWRSSIKIVQAILICQKTWPLGGGGLFSLYIYIENFKNLVRNHLTNFNITWQKCFLGDPLPRLFKLSWFIKKHGRWGRGSFPYISI